jgi:hypothetical protein
MNFKMLQNLPHDEFPEKLGRIRKRQGESDSAWRQRALTYTRETEQFDLERSVANRVSTNRKKALKSANVFRKWSDTAVKTAEAVFQMTTDDMVAASELITAPELPPADYFVNAKLDQDDSIQAQESEILSIRYLMESWIFPDYDLRRIEAKCDLACWKCEPHRLLSCFAENRSLLVGSPDFNLFTESE